MDVVKKLHPPPNVVDSMDIFKQEETPKPMPVLDDNTGN
jgi:hypothetical protein